MTDLKWVANAAAWEVSEGVVGTLAVGARAGDALVTREGRRREGAAGGREGSNRLENGRVGPTEQERSGDGL